MAFPFFQTQPYPYLLHTMQFEAGNLFHHYDPNDDAPMMVEIDTVDSRNLTVKRSALVKEISRKDFNDGPESVAKITLRFADDSIEDRVYEPTDVLTVHEPFFPEQNASTPFQV